MAKLKKTTATQALERAKATVSEARRQGERIAREVSRKKAVRQAGKKVAQLRGRAGVLAGQVVDKVTGRAARKRKRTKIAAAIAGAAVVATAAGIGLARRKR